MTDYLIDNSVWARAISGDAGMVARLRRIQRAPADLLVTCPPQVLQFCHSARTPEEHARYREQISLGFPLEHTPDETLVLDIQAALSERRPRPRRRCYRHPHRRPRHRQRCDRARGRPRLRAHRARHRSAARVPRTIVMTAGPRTRRLTDLRMLHAHKIVGMRSVVHGSAGGIPRLSGQQREPTYRR